MKEHNFVSSKSVYVALAKIVILQFNKLEKNSSDAEINEVLSIFQNFSDEIYNAKSLNNNDKGVLLGRIFHSKVNALLRLYDRDRMLDIIRQDFRLKESFNIGVAYDNIKEALNRIDFTANFPELKLSNEEIRGMMMYVIFHTPKIINDSILLSNNIEKLKEIIEEQYNIEE